MYIRKGCVSYKQKQWVQEKKTIRRVLKLYQKCSSRFQFLCLFFPDNLWKELLCHLWSQFHLCSLQSLTTYQAPPGSPRTSGRWHTPNQTGSRNDVHGPQYERESGNGVSFSCSCKGQLLLHENPLYKADRSRLDPLS